MNEEGHVYRVSGTLVIAENVKNAKIGDVVHIGEQELLGEIVRIVGNKVAIQCFEDTTGLRPGEPVINTNKPLVAELAPGLLGRIYDGLQMPEKKLFELTKNPFVRRGYKLPPLDYDKKWEFIPEFTVKKHINEYVKLEKYRVKVGDKVEEGSIIGSTQETSAIEHKIMVPYGIRGKIIDLREGKYNIKEPIATIELPDGTKKEITMLQYWPVRKPRPYREHLPLTTPLITGQRVIDVFFPIPKGGAGAIPGGFGTGKTVTLHQLARWCDADVVVYIGCGERGNEMADVIAHFPQLKDPRTGKTLSERSIFIANVSNLPVFARESSIYMGVTIAEYYRDMGYDVALMADSTSRWAEAMRDISGRLEEIPAERGFPAYLAERIASFYERSGRVVTLGHPERIGSLTIMGATSPPGGDFSEPVTSTTVRFIGTLWALDKELAFQRHFPAINWLMSFSKYAELLEKYWARKDPKFLKLREEALTVLEEAAKIEEIARIVGEKALPDDQRQILLTAEILRHGFLYQNAFHKVDTYCEPPKQIKMLSAIMQYHEWTKRLVKEGNVTIDEIRDVRISVTTPEGEVKQTLAVTELEKVRMVKGTDYIDELMDKIKEKLDELAEKHGVIL
ncbi:MAG: V-type ATP synthase subunit A [Candidatus Njordarchaeia archaeon]